LVAQAGLRARELVVTPNLPPSHDGCITVAVWQKYSLTVAGAAQGLFCRNETHLFPSFTRHSEKKSGHLTTCSDYKLFIPCLPKNIFEDVESLS
jgi:hypothetical protein